MAAVRRKAVGYTSTESVEEHTVQDGQLVLAKQKTTTKEVPPDIAAAKLVLEHGQSPLEVMSDDELEREKARLLALLREGENANS